MAVELELDLQVATDSPGVPPESAFARWAAAALEGRRDRTTMTIRVVDPPEGAALNLRFRGLDRPTNVLSFPFAPPPGLPVHDGADGCPDRLIGDLVICADVVEREAREQGKDPTAHWAHMVVHGVLHLLGYDHANDAEAAEMEGLETAILEGLGFPRPYEEIEI
jgi:probable rRNA maturation factor